MWFFKHIASFFWILWLFDYGKTEYLPCHDVIDYRKWQPIREEDYKPASPTIAYLPNKNIIVTEFEKRKENFTLIVLAKPFVKDESSCPPDPNTESDLREFHERFFIDVNGNETDLNKFGNVFTGCYYFIITNEKKQNWLWGPMHQQTNYTYHDTMLKCNISQLEPADERSTKGLFIRFRVPNKYFQLEIQLLELHSESENKNETLKQFQYGQIPATQICHIDLINCNENERNVTLKCDRPDTLTTVKAVQVGSVECGKDDSWTISVRWEGLKRDDAGYYSIFSQNNKGKYSYGDLATWIPATRLSIIERKDDGRPSIVPDPVESAQISLKTFIAVPASIIILIFVYWIWKCMKNRSKPKREWNETNVVIRQQEEAWLYDEEKSKYILLIYARGSDKLMQAIHALRDHLKDTCLYQVRDIYSKKEWDEVANLTAPKWIEKMMKDGSKVVWIDTPELRSRLNYNKSDEEKLNQSDVIDSRDIAVSYAVDLAKTSLDSSITQYLRHFVVRIEGFDVTDGDEDPLRMFAPFIRYRYPEHLHSLCEQLNK